MCANPLIGVIGWHGWHRCLACVLLLALASGAAAQTPVAFIAEGNEQFKAKEYEKAAELYRKAQEAGEAPAEAWYNEGCVLLEQGKLAEAADRFRAADASAGRDAELTARARFNLGQALFRMAEPSKEAPKVGAPKTDPIAEAEATLALLRQSASAFRSVLEAAPRDAEAARNVEVVRRHMKRIEDQKKEEQKKQQQQERQQREQAEREANEAQEQADQLKDLAQRQRQAAKDSQQAQQNGSTPDQNREMQQRQEQLRQETRQAQERQQQQDGEQSENALQQAQGEQQQAEGDLGKQDPGGAQGNQERAAELLEQAAQEAQQRANEARQRAQPQPGQGEQPEGDQKGEEGRSQQMADAAPKEEQNYDQLAEALLDRERKLREQRRPAFRAERGVRRPVEKDW